MKFSSVRIVLVATSHPGNIGSAARAMKTMNLSRLYLVAPKLYPDIRATELAAGADDILDDCQQVPTLYEAIKDCQMVIATSARPRDLSLPGILPRELGPIVAVQAESGEVAIVFGNERSGLSNEDFGLCHYHVNIPTNPDYGSLNLSQAVQIIAYELNQVITPREHLQAVKEPPMASVEEMDHFYQHLFAILGAIGFIRPKNPGKVKERIQRLLNRIRLEKMEVAILRGILSHLQKLLPGEGGK